MRAVISRQMIPGRQDGSRDAAGGIAYLTGRQDGDVLHILRGAFIRDQRQRGSGALVTGSGRFELELGARTAGYSRLVLLPPWSQRQLGRGGFLNVSLGRQFSLLLLGR